MPSTKRIWAWTCAAYATIFLLSIWFAAQLPHVAAHHWLAVCLVYGSFAALCAALSFWLFVHTLVDLQHPFAFGWASAYRKRGRATSLACMRTALRGIGKDMVGRRIFFWQMVAWWIMPPFESHAVGPSLDVKIDVVEAMRLLASWVSWAFGTNDEQRQRAAREALPSIVTDFLELASVKAQLQREYEKFRKNPVFVSIPASNPRWASAESAAHAGEAAPHAGEASELVKAFTNFLFDAQDRMRKIISDLKGRLSSLDPEWRLRNVTSLSIIIETVDGRTANAFFVGSYRRFLLEKLDGDRPLPSRPYSNTTPPPQETTYSLDSPDAKEFFGRQQAEAEELRRLAREVAMTANLKPG